MAVGHAMAAVPGLHVAEAAQAEDAAALHRLALWCHRTTPLAAADGMDGLWLDVAGCTHLWGGETALLDHLVRRLAADGFTARAAVADTPGAAHAAARHSEARMVPPCGQAAAVAVLPVAALRLPPDLAATLSRLGFEQVGQLARIPRKLLARRFGSEPGLRLDQAHGLVHEPIQPVPAETPLQHRLAFLEPLLTPEALSAATRHLLDPICARMEREGTGARRIDLLFERVDGAVQAIRIGTARPRRDAAHLARLLDEQLDHVEPGLGIEAMRLVVPLAEPLRWAQTEPGGGDVATLVDRLSNRLGSHRVYRAAPAESDVPERQVRRVAALEKMGGASWGGTLPAPTRLLHPPRPVQAIAALPDHAPAAFIWRRRQHRVRRADGPERIHGEWWRRDAEMAAVRDYFRVEDQDGRRFWLFRQGDGADPATGGLHWFLHGFF